MPENYIKKNLNKFPSIASGRKNFKYHEYRLKKNIRLTNKYIKKIKNSPIK